MNGNLLMLKRIHSPLNPQRSWRLCVRISGEKVMPPSIRLKSQRAVAMNLKEGAGYRSNQGMIWNDLDLKSHRMAVHSETGAMADLFENQRDHLGEYLKAFRLVDCQVGAVFAGGTRVTQRRKGRKSQTANRKTTHFILP
jgi:hypothetical protein